MTVRHLLDQGIEKILMRLADLPEIQAEQLLAVGSLYLELDMLDRAGPPLRKALEIRLTLLGEDHSWASPRKRRNTVPS